MCLKVNCNLKLRRQFYTNMIFLFTYLKADSFLSSLSVSPQRMFSNTVALGYRIVVGSPFRIPWLVPQLREYFES